MEIYQQQTNEEDQHSFCFLIRTERKTSISYRDRKGEYQETQIYTEVDRIIYKEQE